MAIVSQSSNLKRHKKQRVNQVILMPTKTPRRKPRTPQYLLQSSRNSPSKFKDDTFDDPISRGSPLLANFNENDSRFDSNNFFEMDTQAVELNVESELSLNEKHEAILNSIQKIVPNYWDALQQEPYSHTRLSEHCFVVQELDPKNGYLIVSLSI